MDLWQQVNQEGLRNNAGFGVMITGRGNGLSLRVEQTACSLDRPKYKCAAGGTMTWQDRGNHGDYEWGNETLFLRTANQRLVVAFD